MENYPLAERILKEAIERYPMESFLIKKLVDLLIKEAKWEEARFYLRKLLSLELDPKEKARVYYLLGEVHFSLGEEEKAESFLKRAISLDSSQVDYFLSLAKLYEEKEEPHKALKTYKEARILHPEDPKLWKALANFYIQRGMLLEGEELLKKLILNPKTPEKDRKEAYFFLGEIYKKRKSYENAKEYYKKALGIEDPRMLYHLYLSLAEVSLEVQGGFSESISYIEKALSLDPRDNRARLLLARAYYIQGDLSSLEESEKVLTEVIETEKDPILLSSALTLRGMVYYKQGSYYRALEDFNRALELNPSNEEAFFNKKATIKAIEEGRGACIFKMLFYG